MAASRTFISTNHMAGGSMARQRSNRESSASSSRRFILAVMVLMIWPCSNPFPGEANHCDPLAVVLRTHEDTLGVFADFTPQDSTHAPVPGCASIVRTDHRKCGGGCGGTATGANPV